MSGRLWSAPLRADPACHTVGVRAQARRELTAREARAIAIRDAARRKLRLSGRCEDGHGIGPVLTWRGKGLAIGLREPRLGGRYVYGLDVWLTGPAGVRKVLNLEWNRDGAWIVSFRRGPWEELVLALR